MGGSKVTGAMRQRRDVASMLPANATVAAQFVAAAAHAHDCLRLAGVYPASIEFGLKCRARSAAMMREAQGARLLLKRVQVERRKLNRTVRHSTVRRGPSIASPG
jgi:hypothetical protein